MNNPLISICIPCHNTERFLGETIDCLLSQSYKNIEIVVIDDNSVDNSYQVLDFYKKRHPEKIIISKSTNKGASAARNQAFALSKGDLIIFFDADDLIDKNFIAGQLEALGSNTDSVVISKWGRFYNNDLKTFSEDPFIIKSSLTFRQWVENYWTNVTHTTPPGRLLVPRKIIEEAGLWNEGLSLNDDFEFFTRIFSLSKLIIYNNKSTFYYRSGIGGLSSKKSDTSYNSYFNSVKLAVNVAIEKLGNDRLIALACSNVWKMFVYEVYPRLSYLTTAAEDEIKRLGGAKIEFPSGGKTRTLVSLLGWKLVKRIKSL